MRARYLMIAFALVARAASANPAAEKLFQDGRAALKAGRLDEACDDFRRSQELEPRVGTLYNLGVCEEQRKNVASAWEAFVAAKALAATQKDNRQADAEKHAAALLPRLPYLLLTVKRVDGLQITRDGIAVPPAEWDHELPLDPKHYKLSASAPGRVTWTKEIDLAEAQHLAIEVPELAAEPVAVVDKPVDRPVDKPVDKPIGAEIEPPVPTPTRGTAYVYHLGIGAFLGLGNQADAIFGARLVANAAPLGPGWIRLVPVFRRWTGDFGMVQGKKYDTYAVGATIEYVLPVNERIFVAAGAGLGIDYQHDSNQPETEARNVYYVPAVRVSPTLHYDRFDLSISYELGKGPATSDFNDMMIDSSYQRFATFSHRLEVALDFFVW